MLEEEHTIARTHSPSSTESAVLAAALWVDMEEAFYKHCRARKPGRRLDSWETKIDRLERGGATEAPPTLVSSVREDLSGGWMND